MLKTVMNYFTIYLPFFKKINSELFTFKNFPQGVDKHMFIEQIQERHLHEASKIDTKNSRKITKENIYNYFIEKNKIDPLASQLQPKLDNQNEEMNLKDE